RNSRPDFTQSEALLDSASRGLFGGAEPGERRRGKNDLDGDAEILGDTQREVEAGAVLAALQVADRLVMHAERLGELPPRYPAFGAEHRDAVVDDLTRHAASPSRGAPPPATPTRGGPSGAAPPAPAPAREPPRSQAPQRFPGAARIRPAPRSPHRPAA